MQTGILRVNHCVDLLERAEVECTHGGNETTEHLWNEFSRVTVMCSTTELFEKINSFVLLAIRLLIVVAGVEHQTCWLR